MNCTRTCRTEKKKYKPLWVRFSNACSWRTSQPFKTNGKGIGRRKDEKHHPGIVQPPTPPFLLPSHLQPAPPHQSTLFFIGSRPGSYDRQVKVLHSNFLPIKELTQEMAYNCWLHNTFLPQVHVGRTGGWLWKDIHPCSNWPWCMLRFQPTINSQVK